MMQAPKGTQDMMPTDSYKWHTVEALARELCALAGYREIRTPIFEDTNLFLRGVGDTTDIVQKEMYTFNDKGGRSITLRPEGTAGVVRAMIEHGALKEALPVKSYYLSAPVFRYERPQHGRLRQHHQFGIEVFGSHEASIDAEVMHLAWTLLSRLGIGGLTLHLNSIGCPKCRPTYHQKLREFLAKRLDRLCPDCQNRYETNPLRVLDCKVPSCKEVLSEGVPVMTDYLCEECSTHMEDVKAQLRTLGIEPLLDTGIVRGLDYYTRTVFEIMSDSLGAQSTVCGGGRYNGLVKEIGGQDLPGFGFGMGIERLLIILEKQSALPQPKPLYDVFLCTLGDQARAAAPKIVADLRKAGISADFDHMKRGIKPQFKYAGKLGCPFVLVLGDDELVAGQIKLKNMQTSEEQTVKLDDIIAQLKAAVGQLG